MAYDTHCDFCETQFEKGDKRFTLLLNRWSQILCEYCYKDMSWLIEGYKFPDIYGVPIIERTAIERKKMRSRAE